MSEPRVRPATPDDARAIAVVHHTAWVETYSGLLPAVHWETDTVEHRTERWRARLTEPGAAPPSVAVVDGRVVGFGKASATRVKEGIPAVRPDELWSLYVLRECHGTGVGALLLDAVLPPTRPAELWVAEGNPRARRFYEKHGFRVEGAVLTDELGIVEMRMVR